MNCLFCLVLLSTAVGQGVLVQREMENRASLGT